jgi:Arc/MetJ-type ribon-helix-helix transcriptional regulator
MGASERVTVTLPSEIVRDIDRMVRNRSRFVLEAVQHELQRRRRAALRRSLANPHPEGDQLAEAGFDHWASALPAEEAADLVDLEAGVAVRWVAGRGWVETGE